MIEYLSEKELNDIEEKIFNLHKKFREKFNHTETILRNIQIGDILNNKILYLSFPWESYENINIEEKIVITDREKFICSRPHTTGNARYIGYSYERYYNYLYYKNDNKINNSYNYIRYKLPSDYGKVIAVDNFSTFYPYIKIKDNEYKLLEYKKKIWIKNEIPYLQYIDNIEEGINSIADILYKPIGYEYKPWTTVGYYNIVSNDYGLAQKPISKKDFKRWYKNIELLELAIDSFFNIWNIVSYIYWNNNSQYEWEEN